MSNFLQTLKDRGFVQDLTPGLEERLQTPITAYVGFDPTAGSLHVGNLVPVMGLAWLQHYEGTPIILVGGGTGMVGDPSGKRAERPILELEQIKKNADAIERQLKHFVKFAVPNAAKVLNNAEWLGRLGLMEFLRDTGKHFTLNYMLQKESVKSRMETGISYTEFSYMLVQAYDFWHLFQTEGCELQMGGSDQWGNITAGCELVARREGQQVHGLVFPLLTTSSGSKFGKSEDGNVWLDSQRTSVDKFYNFWVNVEDADVERMLKMFTFLKLSEISEIVKQHFDAPGKRTAQHRLAHEVTKLVHPYEITKVEARNRLLFRELKGFTAGAVSEAIAEGVVPEGSNSFETLASALPSKSYTAQQLSAGISLVDALVATGLATSKADARRYLQQGAFAVNREKVGDVARKLGPEDLREGKYILLQKGKKAHAMVRIE